MFKELGAKKEKQQRGRGFLKWEPKEGSLGSSCQKSHLPNSPQMWVETGASLCLLICFNALIKSRVQTAALAQPRWRKEGHSEALQPQLTPASPVCISFGHQPHVPWHTLVSWVVPGVLWVIWHHCATGWNLCWRSCCCGRVGRLRRY